MAAKTKTKLSAAKPGAVSLPALMSEEDSEAYLLLLEGLLAELQPQGGEEEDLARQITDVSWSLLRVRNIAQAFRDLAKPELEPAIAKADGNERRFAKKLRSLEQQFANARKRRRQHQIAEAFEKPNQSSLIH